MPVQDSHSDSNLESRPNQAGPTFNQPESPLQLPKPRIKILRLPRENTLSEVTRDNVCENVLATLRIPECYHAEILAAETATSREALCKRVVNLASPFYREYAQQRLSMREVQGFAELKDGYDTTVQINELGQVLLKPGELNPSFRAELSPLFLSNQITFDISCEARSTVRIEWRFNPRNESWYIVALNDLSVFAELPLEKELNSQLKGLSFWGRVRAIQEARNFDEAHIARALGVETYQYRTYLSNDCDSTKKSPQIIPTLARALVVSPLRLILDRDPEEILKLPWNDQLRLGRIRMGLSHRDVFARMQTLDKGFESARLAPMVAQLQRYEKGEFVPPGDAQRALSKILEISVSLFPAPRRDKTGVHRSVESDVAARIKSFLLTSDISEASGMPPNSVAYEIEATPGSTKRLGNVAIWIPEISTHDTRTFWFTVRNFPILGNVLAVYPQYNSQNKDLETIGRPLTALLPDAELPRTVRLSAYYVLQALKGIAVPVEYSSHTVRLTVQSESLFRVQIDAGIESRVLTLNSSETKYRGFREDALVELRAETLPDGQTVVSVYGLKADEDGSSATLLNVFRGHELKLRGRGASRPLSIKLSRGPAASMDEMWLRDVGAARAQELSAADRGEKFRILAASNEHSEAAYIDLMKSFYPLIENYVEGHLRSREADFSDQLRSTGVKLTVDVIREQLSKNDDSDNETLGTTLYQEVNKALKGHIFSETTRMLRSTGRISLDAPQGNNSDPDAPLWIERLSSSEFMERYGWNSNEPHLSLYEAEADQTGMGQVHIMLESEALCSALKKNSLVSAICQRDTLDGEQREKFLQTTASRIDPAAADEDSGSVALFSLVHALASAGAQFDEILFLREGPHTWRALWSPHDFDPKYKLISQLKGAANEIDEIH